MSASEVGAPTDLELVLGGPAAGGACVARTRDGQVVFVRHGLPGERVRARVTGRTSRFLRADVVEVLQASPERVEPPCPYARPGRCGGCDWQHAALPAQRSMKATLVAEHLRRIAGVEWDGEVEPVPGDVDGLRWRTRISYAADADGRLGLHRHRSHELQHLDLCLLGAPGLPDVLPHRWPGARAVEAATTADAGQASVHVAGRALERPELPGVSRAGLAHRVRGRRFEVSAGGFWQGHVGLPEVLVELVLEALQPRPGESALDLYAGAGLFAALLGEAVGPDGSVLAVEADARAASDAARNTADLPHVRVRTAPVDARLLSGLGRRSRPDLVVLDPPRTGAGVDVAAALAAARPRAVAFVSCDAASFARDLRVLLDAGWTMPWLRALDAYPMTEHVETVALLLPPA